MSEIHKALAVFQLEPGASQDAIQRRYKRLIMVWHPDRFATDDGKMDAEEELKKINNANDVLKKHFATGHRASNCECQRPAGASGGGDQRGHGPGPARKPDDAEAQARKRDEARKKKAASDEAAQKAAEQQQQKTAQTSFEQAKKQQEALKWNKIRWQIAAGEAALFIGLCIFGNVGHGVKEWWHDVSWKWEHSGDSNKPSPSPSPSPDPAPSPAPGPSPFGDPMPPPNTNTDPNMLPNGVMKPFDNSHVPIPHYPSSSTTTTPSPSPGSGFNWQPVTPGTTTDTGSSPLFRKNDWLTNPKPYTSPYEQVAPKTNPAPDTGTTTSTDSGLDLDKYIKH